MYILPTHHRGIDTQLIPLLPATTLVPRAVDTQVIPVLPVTLIPRAMETQVIPVLPVTLVPQAMETKVIPVLPVMLVPRPMNTTVMRDTRPIRQNYEHQGNGAYPPYSGSPGHGEPRQW